MKSLGIWKGFPSTTILPNLRTHQKVHTRSRVRPCPANRYRYSFGSGRGPSVAISRLSPGSPGVDSGTEGCARPAIDAPAWGHVGLLCTAGMLNGVFGEGELRHIAHWQSVKFVDHWTEDEDDGATVVHDREQFSHELTLIFADGRTQVLTHEKQNPSC